MLILQNPASKGLIGKILQTKSLVVSGRRSKHSTRFEAQEIPPSRDTAGDVKEQFRLPLAGADGEEPCLTSIQSEDLIGPRYSSVMAVTEDSERE